MLPLTFFHNLSGILDSNWKQYFIIIYLFSKTTCNKASQLRYTVSSCRPAFKHDKRYGEYCELPVIFLSYFIFCILLLKFEFIDIVRVHLRNNIVLKNGSVFPLSFRVQTTMFSKRFLMSLCKETLHTSRLNT